MAPATTANGAKTSLKLMVDKEKKRVVFAEADSTFVDALFSLMTLPMGTIVRLLEKCPDENLKAIGSLKNLYQSLVDLPQNCLSAEEVRVMMLNPRSSAYDHCRKLKLNIDDTEPIKYYICPINNLRHCYGETFSTCNISRCGKCGHQMNQEIKVSNSTANSVGDGVEDCLFVTNATTYIVTDDLHVIPSTVGVGIQLLSDLGFTDSIHLEEMTFDIGIEQIILLLRGALLFKYALTYMVFNGTHDHVHDQDLLNPRLETLNQSLTVSNETVTTSEKIKLKVHLQKSTSKLLFAEAKDDFVDFVLGFLEIPLGTIVGRLLSGSSSVECLDNLYASILNMEVGCIKSQDLKDLLLQPLLACHYVSRNKIFSLNVSNGPDLYRYSYVPLDFLNPCTVYLSHFGRSGILRVNEKSHRVTLDPRLQGSIFKTTAANFMMTDDLILAPSSPVSAIAMLKKLNVPVDDVEEQEFSIGFEEGLKILKASFKSSTLSSALLAHE